MNTQNDTLTATDAQVVSILTSFEAQRMREETPTPENKTVHRGVIRMLETVSRKAGRNRDGLQLSPAQCEIVRIMLEGSLKSHTVGYEATGEELVNAVKRNGGAGDGISEEEMELYLRLNGMLAA